MSEINVCLFGAGRMAQSHAETIHRLPGVKLYSIVDPKTDLARQLAARYGAIVYHTPEEALQDKETDAVVIVSTTDTHADLIIASAKAGLPIFCEKPIDLDINRIEACLKVVEECNVPLFVGFNRRFDPSFNALRDRVQNGDVGTVELVTISSRDPMLAAVEFLKRSGGLFRDMMIHDFDMARWLTNDQVVKVYAAGSCMVDPSIASFGDLDTAMVTLHMQSGALCHINNSRRTSYGYDQRIEVFGSKGMLRAHNLAPTTVEYSDHNGIRTDKPYPNFPQRYQKAYEIEIEHFINDVVRSGKKPLVSGEDGRQAILIADAVDQSYRTGKPVELFTTVCV